MDIRPGPLMPVALGLGFSPLAPSKADGITPFSGQPTNDGLVGQPGYVPTLGGGLAFYAGLQRLPAVITSIMATLEPVVATTLGWIIFSERLDLPQIISGRLVVGSVILVQLTMD
jgi:drug/metabolite transporter (DMT)-like permease